MNLGTKSLDEDLLVSSQWGSWDRSDEIESRDNLEEVSKIVVNSNRTNEYTRVSEKGG